MKILNPNSRIRIGTICLKCGVKKEDKIQGCSSWGKSWKRHLYKKIKYNEQTIKLPTK